MRTTTDERLGMLSLIIASVAIGSITHNEAVGFAVFFALFGAVLAIKSWLEQIYQVLIRVEKTQEKVREGLR